MPYTEMTDLTEKPELAIAAASEKKESSKVCRYFKKGFCGYGEKCVFSHGTSKIRPRLGINDPSEVENCRFFKKSSCKFASKCWYKHIRPDGKPLRKPDPLNKFIVVGPSSETPDDTPASEGDSPTKIRRSLKRPQNLYPVPTNCFYYEKKGTCYYGDKCWYSHTESLVQVDPAYGPVYELDPELEPDPDHTKMCYNFIFDVCEFGDDCAYVHGDICQFCDLAFLHPFDEQQRKEHLEACEIFFLEDMEISFAFMRSKFKKCTICLDYVWGLDKLLYTSWTFGLQEMCNHIFCLDCLREWRTVKQNEHQTRHCPACRVVSSIVVPSTYWFKSIKEKEEWVKVYKAAVNRVPCIYYEKGRCKKAERCHFLHADFIQPKLPVTESQYDISQDEIWEEYVQNIELPVSEQEGPGNLVEGTQGITDYTNQQNVQDPHSWNDMPLKDQTNEDLALQSDEQVSPNNLADEHQCDDNLGQINVVDHGAEWNVEEQVRQDSDIWEDTPPEDQSNEDSVLQSAEQISAGNLVEEMVEHQFDDNLGQLDVIDQPDVARQIVEQEPGSSFDSASQDQPHNQPFSSGQ